MDALIQFFGRILPSQKVEPAPRDRLADNLTHDDGSYLRQLADQERAQLAANKGPVSVHRPNDKSANLETSQSVARLNAGTVS